MITTKTPAGHNPNSPSVWVIKHSAKIKTGGTILDYAAGQGRHALWLASLGFHVTAIDSDQAALDHIDAQARRIDCGSVTTRQVDLEVEPWPLEDLGTFDGVVVTNYLYRPYLHRLADLLNPEGVLIYETFREGNEAFGKPSSPEYLLKTNELLQLGSQLKIVAYEDLTVDLPKSSCLQRICAVPLQSKV